MNLGKITRKEPSDFERMCGFDGKTCHPQLKTEAREVRYDFKRRIGFVYMGWTCCVDMHGAVTFFEAIDPNVELIVTLEGVDDDGSTDYRLDTCYFKVSKRETDKPMLKRDPQWNGEWGAFVPSGATFRWGATCEGLTESEVQAAWRRIAALPEAQATVART